MRTTLQDIATRYRFHPRKLLRAVAVELDAARSFDDGPFEIVLDEIGVSARKSEEATKTTYTVTNEDTLVAWFQSVDTVRISRADAESTARVLDGFRQMMLRSRGRPQPESYEARMEGYALHFARVLRGEPSEPE